MSATRRLSHRLMLKVKLIRPTACKQEPQSRVRAKTVDERARVTAPSLHQPSLRAEFACRRMRCCRVARARLRRRGSRFGSLSAPNVADAMTSHLLLRAYSSITPRFEGYGGFQRARRLCSPYPYPFCLQKCRRLVRLCILSQLRT